MASTLAPYLNCVRRTLTAALCLQNFSSQMVERHNKPEVEAKDHLDPDGKPKMTSRELMLHSVTIARNKPNEMGRQEKTLIEGSINSVRVSIAIKQADELEEVLVRRFTRFVTQRAEHFVVLRRKPIEGYDISFLITNVHTEDCFKHMLVNFIIEFMEVVDQEVNAMKLAVSARARISAATYLQRMT
eukprot:CAMPEP_0198340410 /NCGR_PEP_ID=MMETSP1450-20131203/44173_1 /TAXON_ID=753684 ORGANISM="Madagascaria erythrocladiodes, Strain CCMP3234" /NCGR_SAMPLE_ID=MMETSP1450 /ASSEMBLY_ACC=CAM_ASM_001115 /LENGTH=186 /DNA_ID=CAMNT_0044045385 /DNA_START=99 /DNA_END=659 /DNA_ORIENTATION=+